MKYKLGIGYDIHRLVEGRKLFIGGIEIPYSKGSLGHSDADVLLHAVCDALLGAAEERDIGELFPDSDPKYQDVSSMELFKIVADLLRKRGFQVNNIDAVIILEEPKLSSFKKRIQENIAAVLRIREEYVNLKTKTNEGLGEIGRKEAIACHAVAMLIKGE